MIPFSKPPITEKGIQYILNSLDSGKISGDHFYTKKCHAWLETNLLSKKALLTTSGTHSLELSALLLNITTDDEVILPSFTFSSTANAFLLRGAKLKFIDIRPDTMNIDEKKIEAAITKKTKAIIPVHYAGIPCEMDEILKIAKYYNLFVVEDAAQAILSEYKGKPVGSIGNMGCLSFHETKNITCGEGGALLLNDDRFSERAEIIREKGTNRAQFFRGEVDKYTWRDIGSSFLISDINAAFLFSQLEIAREIIKKRLEVWNFYYNSLKQLEESDILELPKVDDNIKHNAHIFFIKLKNKSIRNNLLKHLRDNDIYASFHYIPLHSTKFGKSCGEFVGEDLYTTADSERLLRIPIFSQMDIENEASKVINCIFDFFNYK